MTGSSTHEVPPELPTGWERVPVDTELTATSGEVSGDAYAYSTSGEVSGDAYAYFYHEASETTQWARPTISEHERAVAAAAAVQTQSGATPLVLFLSAHGGTCPDSIRTAMLRADY